MKDVPVFIVNGFLESGKTSLILETLRDPEFNDGGKTLVLLCEEGEVELDPIDMKKLNTDTLVLEAQDELNPYMLESCRKQYNPDRVMIEFNGTWNLGPVLQMDLPKGWLFAQILTLVDASTFENYWNNMRGVMGEQLRYSDTIIFNRCDENTDRIKIRRSVKPLNRKAQLMYEALPGVELQDQEEPPIFDLSENPIEIPDDDFGMWYMDAMDHPERYKGRDIHFKGLVYKDKSCRKGTFIPGRMAMSCCVNDMAFVGFICNYSPADEALVQFVPKQRKWVDVVANVAYGYRPEYGAEGPVLTSKSIKPAEPPVNDVVYFS